MPAGPLLGLKVVAWHAQMCGSSSPQAVPSQARPKPVTPLSCRANTLGKVGVKQRPILHKARVTPTTPQSAPSFSPPLKSRANDRAALSSPAYARASRGVRSAPATPFGPPAPFGRTAKTPPVWSDEAQPETCKHFSQIALGEPADADLTAELALQSSLQELLPVLQEVPLESPNSEGPAESPPPGADDQPQAACRALIPSPALGDDLGGSLGNDAPLCLQHGVVPTCTEVGHIVQATALGVDGQADKQQPLPQEAPANAPITVDQERPLAQETLCNNTSAENTAPMLLYTESRSATEGRADQHESHVNNTSAESVAPMLLDPVNLSGSGDDVELLPASLATTTCNGICYETECVNAQYTVQANVPGSEGQADQQPPVPQEEAKSACVQPAKKHCGDFARMSGPPNCTMSTEASSSARRRTCSSVGTYDMDFEADGPTPSESVGDSDAENFGDCAVPTIPVGWACGNPAEGELPQVELPSTELQGELTTLSSMCDIDLSAELFYNESCMCPPLLPPLPPPALSPMPDQSGAAQGFLHESSRRGSSPRDSVLLECMSLPRVESVSTPPETASSLAETHSTRESPDLILDLIHDEWQGGKM